MSAEARKLAQSWHRLQKTRGSCVAACRAIVDARHGGEGEEQETFPALGGEMLDTSLPESFDVLVARVKCGELAIVTVNGPNWMALARDRQMLSIYGDLGDGLHAVVIIAVIGSFFVILDPYFPTKHQPVQVTRDDFATAWSGEVEFFSSEG
ncbi:hypothetical protein WME91_28590 [Sorangium sp. So ce269]